MPYKLWAPFERLLSTDMNTYVAQQVVPQFATAAARDTAIPTPVAGQVCYLIAPGVLQVYAGGWKSLQWAGGDPGAELYSTATQSIANTGNIPVTSLTAVGHDTHGYALGSSALTIPAGLGGRYLCVLELLYASGGTAASLMAALLMIGGVQFSRADTTNTSNGGGVIIAAVHALAAGQVVTAQARQTSSGAINIAANCRLAIERLGD